MSEFETTVIIASGPSVTQEQVDLIKKWRSEGGNRRVVVVNRSYEIAPWADCLFTMDGKFLRLMQDKIRKDFQGELVTYKGASFTPKWATILMMKNEGNSGADAITMAVIRGAKRILLVGCDCRVGEDGKRHHHSDYEECPSDGEPKDYLRNAPNILDYKPIFERAIKKAVGVEIINCSPISSIRIIPRIPLEEALYAV